MKKLSLILIMGILPTGAFAARTSPSTCEVGGASGADFLIEVPAGYCCISYYENGSFVERTWNCDNLDLEPSSMAACKSERTNCIEYCDGVYDLDNNTCGNYSQHDPCAGDKFVESVTDSTECDDPNATLCDYDLYCDLCGNNCFHFEEKVYECIDEHYYTATDFSQCLKCPGHGVFNWDFGNVGIAGCYIPRNPMTGSDATGTFQYVNDKCYWQE